MAVGNPAAALDRTIERGAPVNAADSMELCSTAEIVEVFGEYYDADIELKEKLFLISDSRTSIDLDFDHPALTQVQHHHPLLVFSWVTTLSNMTLTVWCLRTEHDLCEHCVVFYISCYFGCIATKYIRLVLH